MTEDESPVILNFPENENETKFDPWNQEHATGQEVFVANQQDSDFFPKYGARETNDYDAKELEDLPNIPYSRSDIRYWAEHIPYLHGEYAGVVRVSSGRYKAVLECEEDRKISRPFSSAEEAAKAYDDLARVFGPKRCRLNFPNEGEPVYNRPSTGKMVKFMLDQERKRRQAVALIDAGERKESDFSEEIPRKPFTVSPSSKAAVNFNPEVAILQNESQMKQNSSGAEAAIMETLRCLDRMTPKSLTHRKLFSSYGTLRTYPFRQTVRYKANSALLREGECVVDGQETGDHFSVCSSCGRGGNLILCDHCPGAFHQECSADTEAHGFPAADTEWICPICQMHDGLMACSLENLLGIGGFSARMIKHKFPIIGRGFTTDGFGIVRNGGKDGYTCVNLDPFSEDDKDNKVLLTDRSLVVLNQTVRRNQPRDGVSSLVEFFQKQNTLDVMSLASLRCRSVFTVEKDIAKEKLLKAWSSVDEECAALLDECEASLGSGCFGDTFDQRYHDGTAVGGPYRGIMMKHKQQGILEELSMKQIQRNVAELAWNALSKACKAISSLENKVEGLQSSVIGQNTNGHTEVLSESIQRKLSPEAEIPEVALTDKTKLLYSWVTHPGLSVRLCSSLLSSILDSGTRWYLPSDIQVNREGFPNPLTAALAANIATIRVKGSALPHQLNYLPGPGTGFVGVMPPFGYAQLAAVNAKTVKYMQSDRLKDFRDHRELSTEAGKGSAPSGEAEPEPAVPDTVLNETENDDEISCLQRFEVVPDDPVRVRLAGTAGLNLLVGAAEYVLHDQTTHFIQDCDMDSLKYLQKHCTFCRNLSIQEFGVSEFFDNHWENHITQALQVQDERIDWDSDDSSECAHAGLDSAMERQWLEYTEENCDFRQDDVVLNWKNVNHSLKEMIPETKRRRTDYFFQMGDYHHARVRQEYLKILGDNEDAVAPLVSGGLDISQYFMGNSSGQFVNNLPTKKARKRPRPES